MAIDRTAMRTGNREITISAPKPRSGFAASLFLVLLLTGPARPADAPIGRMEASTVRVLAKSSAGTATGSGFVVGDGSYVVTNHHVIDGAQALLVLGRDLKQPGVRVVADSSEKDLAVIQLRENSGRPSVVLGLRSGVKKTQTVLAAGFPGAADEQDGDSLENFLEVKFTKGIVSAFVRSQSGTMLYQIDAPINPGNSGGPLFDECGNVIGVDAMKSLRPAVVVGPDGKPAQERLPYGEGVAWAIQADELVSVLQMAGITPKLASGVCGEAGSTPPAEAPRTEPPPAPQGGSVSGSSGLILTGAALAIVLGLAGVIGARMFSRQQEPAAVQVAAAQAAAANAPNYPPPAPNYLSPAPNYPPPSGLRLLGTAGAYVGKEFPLSVEPITIGRDPHVCQIVFHSADSMVSKRHCTVRLDRSTGGMVVEDCGSTNGTFLESGERLRVGEPRLVRPYGSFYLGGRTCSFQVKV
jgi:S1-C subfamily serine protease